MSIYPDRKIGQLTGRFAVEAQRKGNRLRGCAISLAEAKKLEAELEAEVTEYRSGKDKLFGFFVGQTMEAM